jgi:hypothetical protein
METKLKQKIICKNVTRNIRTGHKSKPFKKVTRRVCRKKYKHIENITNKIYYRDDDKYCYENHKGVNIPFREKNCGWYLNDKKKVSNDYHFLNPEEYVWRQH